MSEKLTAEKIAAVLEKIERLRALANGAGTQAEAETAAAQAEALIAKYQIEEADLEARSDKMEGINEGEALHVFGMQANKWIEVLAMRLAKLHGCFTLTDARAKHTDKKQTLRIFGRNSDVVIVRYLFGWLTYEIERLSQREQGKADRNAFRLGAVVGVTKAMQKAQQDTFAAQQSASTSAAIVLVSRAVEAESFAMATLKERGSKFATHRSPEPRRDATEAFFRGKSAGEGLSPRAGLNSGTPIPMLGR